jgi:tRNA-specific 2-thiouridylase
VVVRYRAAPIACRVEKLQGDGSGWRVLLAMQAKWVTPGQAAVFYAGDRVLGGGFIGSRPKPVLN